MDGGGHTFLGGARACRRRRGVGARDLALRRVHRRRRRDLEARAPALRGPRGGARRQRAGPRGECSSRAPRARSERARRSTSVTWRSGRSPPRISRRTGAMLRSACSCARRSIASSRRARDSGRRAGFAPRLNTTGVKVEAESLVTLLLGGIAFEPGPDEAEADDGPAPPGHHFLLYRSHGDAMKRPDGDAEEYTLVFHQSVRGLAVGAPGRIPRAAVRRGDPHPPRLRPGDLRVRDAGRRAHLSRPPARAPAPRISELPLTAEARMRRFVDHGLRAQLRTASLLTGQRFVAVDFFPAAPRVKLDAVRQPREIPTLASDGDRSAGIAGRRGPEDRPEDRRACRWKRSDR